tara:strand:+ start:4969 stop:5778 length:810 start_codon:yes stop_codon:yes gene_type:complete
MSPSDQIIPNMPAWEYHRDPSISKSGLDQFRRSPAHYKAWLAEDREQTPAMRIGTLTHLAVLEPDTFDSKTVVAPLVDKRTKEGKSIWEQFKGENAEKEIITIDERDQIVAMRESVHKHQAAGKLLVFGGSEISVFAVCPKTKVMMKGRFDWLDGNTIVDLKTTEDASPEGFAKSVANYRYHIQAAHYIALAGLVGIKDATFKMIAVEKSAPYAVAVYELDAADLILAEAERIKLLEMFSSCTQFQSWPAYSQNITTISLPRWATKSNP